MPESVRDFIGTHCLACHGPEKQKADLRLDTLPVDFSSPQSLAHWEEAMHRMTSGEMPPAEETRPDPDAVTSVAQWIADQLLEAEAQRHAGGNGAAAFHRLSNEEIAHTLRDLLGPTYHGNAAQSLPEDGDLHGMERIGSMLTLSPAHIEKLYTTLDATLDEALSLRERPANQTIAWGPFDIRTHWSSRRAEYESRGLLDRVRLDIVPNNGNLDRATLHLAAAGEYTVRVRASGLRPAGGPAPRIRIYCSSLNLTLLEADVDAPEDRPVTLEARVFLPAGTHEMKIINAVPGPNPQARRSRSTLTPVLFTRLDQRVPWQMKFTDDDGSPLVPFLLLDGIEWIGPRIDAWPTPAHARIFFGGSSARPDPDYAREILARFAARAWRRPLAAGESDRLLAVFTAARERGEDFPTAIKSGLLAILSSTKFLFLHEGAPAAAGDRTRGLDPFALAARLSYFLWGTLPDDQLRQAAANGTLASSAVRRQEVRRMLADARTASLATSFPRQWLQLRKVGMFPPDRTLYPSYDDALERSMLAETVGFFGEVLRADLSVREFLHSDWTLVNEKLAAHYGIAGVQGDALRRVKLLPEHRRGGVLTHAAILSQTSDGTRHRPVHRGVWFLESILNRPPPPPPANVPPIETDGPRARATTLREKIEAHRADPSCASCHRRIDPLGLAFEHFDAIGRWRVAEAPDGTAPVNASGRLADGRAFAGLDEFKALLLHDLDAFAQAFVEKLATFALRRRLTFGDRQAVAAIARVARQHDYRLRAILEELVASDLFAGR